MRQIASYEHNDKDRPNNPPAGLVSPQSDPDGPAQTYAYDPHLDTDLGRRDLSHLFPWEVTRMAQARSKYPRTFQRAFMELFQQEAATLVRERQRGE